MFVLYSPKGTYDPTFLANYCYININDPMTRVPGMGSVSVFGAGQYAMRIWVQPDRLATLNITVPEVINAVQAQNNVNPAGQIGGEPVPPGQVFTFTVNTTGRLVTAQDFENIIIRANSDGSIVRVKDVATVNLGSQVYNLRGRFNGQNAAILAIYQLPGSNAVDCMKQARALMEKMKQQFPEDLDYKVALDTTLAVTEGMKEIVKTLFEAMALVILVVFIFLQGWRATLIPLIAVPVSLIGTFAIFPLLGFSINTLSLFGLVLAIGLVVDDAIVVVEAIESHIEEGLSPRDAAFKAMAQVQGPVVAIALILAAVFIPTVFIPGITGAMYQQFAVTMAVSVIISAFNALTLSPALGALLLRPRKEGKGPLARFFRSFNTAFGKATNGYGSVCASLIRKVFISLVLILLLGLAGGGIGAKMPSGFIPEEDQGYLFGVVQLPTSLFPSANRCGFKRDRGYSAQDSRRRIRDFDCRLQPAKLRSEHLHGFLFHHARGMGQTQNTRVAGRCHSDSYQSRTRRASQADRLLRVSASGHSRCRNGRRRDVYSGRPEWRERRVHCEEYSGIHAGGQKASGADQRLHDGPLGCSPILPDCRSGPGDDPRRKPQRRL